MLHVTCLSACSCRWARSAVSEAVGFSIGSLPMTLKPPSPLLGFNRIRWKPVFCLSGTRSMASFPGSCCVQERCYFSLHLVCITVNSRVRVWKKRRWQNVLFEKVKINVFYVSILISAAKRESTKWESVKRDSAKRDSGKTGFGETGFGETWFGETGFGKTGFGKTWFGKTGFGEKWFGGMRFGGTGYGVTGFGETGFGENSALWCTLNLPHPLTLLISPHYFHRSFCWSHMNHCFHTLNRQKFSFIVYFKSSSSSHLLISPHFITYFGDHTWTIVF